MSAPKQYDRDYYDRWYRGADRVVSHRRVATEAAYVVGLAEYLLGRPLLSVLDVGCGEGQWSVALRRLRPGIAYLGVDPSEYAVARFGRRRNLVLGDLAGLDAVVAEQRHDLVLCADVLAYVDTAGVRRGLDAIARRLGGVLFAPVFTSADDFVGDLDGFARRRPSTYRRLFAEAGLHRVGPHCYAGDALLPTLAVFEGGIE